jgi:hypothetical protein
MNANLGLCKGRAQTERVSEQAAEENIRTYGRGSNRTVEKHCVNKNFAICILPKILLG